MDHSIDTRRKARWWRGGATGVGLLALGGAVWGAWGLARQLGAPHKSASPVAEEKPQEPQSDTRLLRRPVKLTDGIYLLGNMWPSSVYVVDTSEGLVMVDSGLESAHDTLLAGMSQLGLDVGRLKMILLTHAHGDHTMGAQRLHDETGAKIFIGREDAEPLRRGGPWDAVFSKFPMDRESLHPTTIEGELVDEQVLELGEARITVLATSGHTPGSCCYLLELHGRRVLFTGDTIMSFTVGTGTYAAQLPPRYRGDANRYRHSFEKLRRLPLPDLVLPGHPAAEPMPANPRLSQEQWNSIIELGIAESQALEQRYQSDGTDFLDGTPKEIAESLYYLGDRDGRAVYALCSDEGALVFGGLRDAGASVWLAAAWQSLGVVPPKLWAVVLTSCRPEELAGLISIVGETGCRVVAPGGGVESVAGACPAGATVVSGEELASVGWEGIAALPIAGAGEPQAGYWFRRGASTVLISGTVPIDADEDEFARLRQEGPPPDWDLQLLGDSLDRLEKIAPDVWLSAAPWRGRNANLYDRAWTDTVMANHRLVSEWRAAQRWKTERRGGRYGR